VKKKSIPNPWDYYPPLEEIVEKLRKISLLKDQMPFDIAVYFPKGIFRDFGERFASSRLINKTVKSDFFSLYSSVAIFSIKNSKERLLVFKDLGRAPGELLIHIASGYRRVYFCPFLCYWKGKWFDSFPATLLKHYPEVTSPYFWYGDINKYRSIEEIPLKLAKDVDVKTTNIIFVRRVLKSLDVIEETRGKKKPKDKYLRDLTITIYLKLCKENPVYFTRWPVDKIHGQMAKKTQNEKLPYSLQTIRRWIKEYYCNKELEQFFIRIKQFNKDFRKGMKDKGIDYKKIIREQKLRKKRYEIR